MTTRLLRAEDGGEGRLQGSESSRVVMQSLPNSDGFAHPDPTGHHATSSQSYTKDSLGIRDPATTFFNLN